LGLRKLLPVTDILVWTAKQAIMASDQPLRP